jgi:hypothetical protein
LLRGPAQSNVPPGSERRLPVCKLADTRRLMKSYVKNLNSLNNLSI